MTESTPHTPSAATPPTEPTAAPAHASHGTGATAEPALLAALAPPNHEIKTESEIRDMKLTMIDSAELANRAAALAAKAGAEMHQEAQNMVKGFNQQRRNGVIVLVAFGTIIVIACALFVWMSIRLQSRVSQLDAVLIAVGKRAVAMDDSLEAVAATSDTLRDMSAKQDAISNQLARNDVRLEEVIKALGEASSKTSEARSAEILKLLQGLDSRLQAQASAVKSLAAQPQSAPRPTLDASVIRREVEAALRQQRQAQEAAAKAAAPAPVAAIAPPAPAKPREQLVQYPRTQAQGNSP
ncbi:MAG: hypothetical protein ACR2I0_14980 [Rhodoferax sp.]